MPTTADKLRQLGYTVSPTGTASLVNDLSPPTTTNHGFQPLISPTVTSYATIIRQLPARNYVNILVQNFFQNAAWHYDIVDATTFNRQLVQWSSLSYSQLKQAPDSIPTSLASFPSLLFQVLAQALLFQPIEYDKSLDNLKYAADMELSDLAADFSDAGHLLASCFTKRELTLSTIQARLMRACFEKTIGAVIEAWHTLGTAIRDAQELGLHLLEPEPILLSTTEQSLEREQGRKVWLILHLWDTHMAIVLGRPMLTRMNPDAVPSPMSWTCDPVTPKVPKPRDVILCGYHTAYKFLQNIRDIEHEKIEACRSLVECIHDKITTSITNLPAWATAQRSGRAEPLWMSAALETMITNIQFVLFALHRPFIFAEQSSRKRAFHSATQILESQARLFDQMQHLQYNPFTVVFATFDAMVLIAALQIRFADEFTEELPATKRNLEWGLKRLAFMQTQNSLAGSALIIIEQLYRRLMAVVSPQQKMSPSYGTADSMTAVGTEDDMSRVDLSSLAQSELVSIPPQPLNELLGTGAFGFFPDFLTDPAQLQFELSDHSEKRPEW